jgi:hypothetical protein
VPFRAARRSRAALPATEKTSLRPWIGAPHHRQLEVSCFSVTTRMRPQVNGIIGPLTILGPTNRDWPKAPAMAAARHDSGKRSMTFIERVTAVPARPAVMDGIAITSVCWRFRSTTCRSAPGRPAARSSEKHAGTLSPKRSLSVSISGDFLHSRGSAKRAQRAYGNCRAAADALRLPYAAAGKVL